MKARILVYHTDPREQENILEDVSDQFEVMVAGTPETAARMCRTFQPEIIVVGEPLFPGGLELKAYLEAASHDPQGFPRPVLIAYQTCPEIVFDFKGVAEKLGFHRLCPRWTRHVLHSLITTCILEKSDQAAAHSH